MTSLVQPGQAKLAPPLPPLLGVQLLLQKVPFSQSTRGGAKMKLTSGVTIIREEGVKLRRGVDRPRPENSQRGQQAVNLQQPWPQQYA